MPMRLRKLIGAFALFALVTVWALLAMAVAQFPAIRDNVYLSVAYYVIAGHRGRRHSAQSAFRAARCQNDRGRYAQHRPLVRDMQ